MSEREMAQKATIIQAELGALKAVELALRVQRQRWLQCEGSTLSKGALLALDAAIDRVKLMQWERE